MTQAIAKGKKIQKATQSRTTLTDFTRLMKSSPIASFLKFNFEDAYKDVLGVPPSPEAWQRLNVYIVTRDLGHSASEALQVFLEIEQESYALTAGK